MAFLYKLKFNQENKFNSLFNYFKFLIFFNIEYGFYNFPFFIVLICLLQLLGNNLILDFITFMLTAFSAYIFHVLAHKYETTVGETSGHNIHHNKRKKSFFDDTREFSSDIFASGSLLLLFNWTLQGLGYNIFNNYVILLFMIGFPVVHLTSYEIWKNTFHGLHHQYPDKNFAPDIFDFVFGTNFNNQIENLNHMIPTFIIIGLALYFHKTK